jgi:hypothetical protein
MRTRGSVSRAIGDALNLGHLERHGSGLPGTGAPMRLSC